MEMEKRDTRRLSLMKKTELAPDEEPAAASSDNSTQAVSAP